MKPHFTILCLGLGLLPSAAMGQNTRELIQNEIQIMLGKEMLERDSRELASFRATAAAIESALNAGQFPKAQSLAEQLVESMYREINQTKAKIEFAQAEVGQSRSEQGTNRRENRRNRSQYSGSGDDRRDITRDRRNARDDRRDSRNDVLDLTELNNRFENQKALYNKMKAVNFSTLRPGAKEEINEQIVRAFIATLEADLEETREELQEDQQERREDRRERKDDRLERRERF